MTLSNVEICASRALSAAALNLRTLSCDVSPTGPGVFFGIVFDGGFEACFAEAWGVVEVNRVSSAIVLALGVE